MSATSFVELPLKRVVFAPELEFHYVEAGQGAPLVFIHGGSGDFGSWGPQWDAFTPHFRCIAYSRRYNTPNHNLHASPNHSAWVEAEDLRQLLAAWGASPAVLVGSSYGGYTALALALRHPELVRALVLVEPPVMSLAQTTDEGRAAFAEFDRNARQPAREAFLRGDDEAGAWLLGSGILGRGRAADLPEAARARRLRNARAMRMLTLSTDEFPVLDDAALAALAAPTLLLSGENTPRLHACAFAALCHRLPQAVVHRVAGAGHSVSREQPAEFNRAALAFLAKAGLTHNPDRSNTNHPTEEISQ